MKKSGSPGVLPLTFGLWCIGVIPPQRSSRIYNQPLEACSRWALVFVFPPPRSHPRGTASVLSLRTPPLIPYEILSRLDDSRLLNGSLTVKTSFSRYTYIYIYIYRCALLFFLRYCHDRGRVRGWRRCDDGWISGESLLFPITRKHTRARDSSGRFSHDGSEC